MRRSSKVLGLLVGAGTLSVLACGSDVRHGFEATQPEARGGAAAAPPATPGFGDGGTPDATSPPPLVSSDPVDVVFTADNAYAFGWGSVTSLSNFESRPNTMVAGDIFNCPVLKQGDTCTTASGCGPEAYVVPAAEAPPTAYLYVVAWSDEMTTQGALGQFKRGAADTLYTGDDAWEVCATGVEHDPSDTSDPGPSKADVEAKIALCNAGSSNVVSHGWVNENGPVTPNALGVLAVGEDNARNRATDPGGQPADGVFPITCQQDQDGTPGIDAAARWMWYQSAGMSSADAFTGNAGNVTGTYLIFRVKAEAIPIVPPK